MSSTAIYGREAELAHLRQFVAQHCSLLLHGATGVGKTLLLKALTCETPQMLYCSDSSSSQEVFRALAGELLARDNRRVVRAFGQGGLVAIKDRSAVSLRGIVTEALGEGRYYIVLDHVRTPSQSFAAALKEMCSRTEAPVLAAARSEHMEDVGFLLPLFSGRSQKVALKNFNFDTARRFAIQAAKDAQFEAENHDEVIEKIVRFSKGNPGAIVAMLKMAGNPKYVSRQQVKLSPLYIDFRLSGGANHG
jgi:hypothetical protein